MSVDGFLYNERLNQLDWKGCKDLWKHKGVGHPRNPPVGFRTVGVPGVLASLKIEGALGVAHERLDDLVRGYVSDRGAADGVTEFEPIFILEKHPSVASLMGIASDRYQSWVYDDPSYGWVEFADYREADAWLRANK